MIKEGTIKDVKDPLKITSGPLTRKKANELTSALQAFVSSFLMENGLGILLGGAGTCQESYGDDGQAWILIDGRYSSIKIIP